MPHNNLSDQTPLDRMQDTGYPPIANRTYTALIAENIAKGQNSPWTVVSAWMDSPAHRTNILSSDLKEIGIGISGDIWVQNFGGVRMVE
ncbi:MAG: CAP domain-containing protein [bacterium]|nr:CAP domain-containing protein [bacterium]